MGAPKQVTTNNKMEEFEALLEKSFEESVPNEGQVISGKVIAIEAGQAIVDIGYKMEGRVDLKEFGDSEEVKVEDTVQVFFEKAEDSRGEAALSREKARREDSWDQLEKAFANNEKVEGYISKRVKGGFAVDLNGANAFLPGSQVDVRPVRDAGSLMGVSQPFLILKMDRPKKNIVVSRRAILEESRAEQRAEVINRLNEGDDLDGTVKNITDYGAFIDLGGVDGLLHVTDMAWHRIHHPSELLSIGETVRVKVIRIKRDTHRISLGMRQLEPDPWLSVEEKYPLNSRHVGVVTNIQEYGAFVELAPGVEGLVHVTEMSWTKKNIHPGKIVSTSQEVEVMVLSIDVPKRRVSLGLKQTMQNPWEAFAEQYSKGQQIEGEVKSVTEFGVFVGLENEIDGMIHMSGLTWDRDQEAALKSYKKGDIVKAMITEIDVEKERVALSIKEMVPDPFAEATKGIKKNAVVTVQVTAIEENGIKVNFKGVESFIRRSDLSSSRSEQRPERFNVGDSVDAKVTNIDSAQSKIGLSIKAREISEEKEAVEQYGSSDSGAVLGDILGDALKDHDSQKET